MSIRGARWTTALTLLAAALGLLPAHAQSNQPGDKFTAFAVNMSGVGRAGSGIVYITVDRYSSEAEAEKLRTVFFDKGPGKLLDALQDTRPVGYFRTPSSLRWDIRFAKQVPTEEGGRRIYLLTDRRIGFHEARNQPRSIDYPFTLVELVVDKDGNGEGRASVATKITFNEKKNTIELENFGQQPVMLTKVSKTK